MSVGCTTNSVSFLTLNGAGSDSQRVVPGVESVEWTRVRDEISTARVVVGPDCYPLLGDILEGRHELHIHRHGELVWRGMITRTERDRNQSTFYAEDMLWLAKKHVITKTIDCRHPNIRTVVSVAHEVLTDCFERNGDRFDMVAGITLHPTTPEARTSKTWLAYSTTSADLVDGLADNNGIDFTAVADKIHIFDTHVAWNVLPRLKEEYIDGTFTLVGYTSEMGNRVYVTNGSGYAGIAVAPQAVIDVYGDLDYVGTNWNEGVGTTENPPKPSLEDLILMAERAVEALDDAIPPNRSIRVSDSSRLSPSCPWDLRDMIPGSWFEATMTHGGKLYEQWNKLDRVVVREDSVQETIEISSSLPPKTRQEPIR